MVLTSNNGCEIVSILTGKPFPTTSLENLKPFPTTSLENLNCCLPFKIVPESVISPDSVRCWKLQISLMRQGYNSWFLAHFGSFLRGPINGANDGCEIVSMLFAFQNSTGICNFV